MQQTQLLNRLKLMFNNDCNKDQLKYVQMCYY